MVILAAAAAATAGYGAWRGGKAAVDDVKTRNRRRQNARAHRQAHEEERDQRKVEEEKRKAEASIMSTEQRLERFKNNAPASTKRKGFFGGRK